MTKPASESEPKTKPGGQGDYQKGDAPRLPDFPRRAALDADDIRVTAHAYYLGIFEGIGAYKAAAELATRFLRGRDLGHGDARDKLCEYIKHQPLRLDPGARRRVLLGVSDDPRLVALLLRLSDAIAARDLAPAALPRPAARLAVVEALYHLAEQLERSGGGGVSLVASEAGRQLMDVLAILDHAELKHGGADDDVFDVIAGLIADTPGYPNAGEGRRLARMASSGRKLFIEIADRVQALPESSDGDLDTIAGLVYHWRAAYESVGDREDDGDEREDEHRLRVIRLRQRVL
jgi:hypothetical protein